MSLELRVIMEQYKHLSYQSTEQARIQVKWFLFIFKLFKIKLSCVKYLVQCLGLKNTSSNIASNASVSFPQKSLFLGLFFYGN